MPQAANKPNDSQRFPHGTNNPETTLKHEALRRNQHKSQLSLRLADALFLLIRMAAYMRRIFPNKHQSHHV